MQCYSPAENSALVQLCCTFFDSVLCSVFMQISQEVSSRQWVLVNCACGQSSSLSVQFFCVGNMSLWFLILSLFSHCMITDDQTQVVESSLCSLHWVCVYIVLSFRLTQRWSSLSKALNWLMLGWPLCNFAQGLACVNSTVNINIWITVLCNSQLVSLAMPQGFPAMRKAITITLSKVSPHLFKLARLASVGVCGRYSSWAYI